MLLMALQACGGDKSKLLLKTWRIENLRYSQEVPPELKPQVDGWVSKMKDEFSLTYYKDGTYTTNLRDQKMKGTWKMGLTGNTITSTGSDGVPKDFKVVKLTDKEFTFETTEGDQKVIFDMVPAEKQEK